MDILIGVLLVHIIELVAIGVFLIVKTNIKLRKIVEKQQQYINETTILFSELNDNFNKLDQKVYIKGDADLEEVFENIKSINENIESFYSN